MTRSLLTAALVLFGLATTPAQAIVHNYVEVPTLIVIYTNWYKDAGSQLQLTAADIDQIKAEVDRGVDFFWRGSHLRCHVTTEYLIVNRPLGPAQMWSWTGDGGCWMPPWSVDGQTSVRDDVLAAGYRDGDFASVVVFYAFVNDDEVWAAIGGGAYGPYIGVLGPAGYVGIPLGWGLGVQSVFVHEFLHELDSFFDASGNPQDMFHADHAATFTIPDTCGWDFNWKILTSMSPGAWLQLDPRWGRPASAPDADADGVPDSGSAPITEASLGTSPLLADTDDDDRDDRDELMATFHGPSDPLNPDTDGDGLRDGVDPYPLYAAGNHGIRRSTPTLNGVISPGEYTEIARFTDLAPDIGAVVYAAWTPDALYIAADVTDQTITTWFSEPWWCDHLAIMINTSPPDWFIDTTPGNYHIRIVPDGARGIARMSANDIYEDPGHDSWHPLSIAPATARYVRRTGGYIIESCMPVSALPGLTLAPFGTVHLSFDVLDIDDWEWPIFNVITGVDGERTAFVELTLTSVAGDMNCDGGVDTADIDGFVLALVDPAGYTAQHPGCDRLLADLNGDGQVDTADIDAFVAHIVGN